MKTPEEFVKEWSIRDDTDLVEAIAARDAEHAAERDALAAKCGALEAENLLLYQEPTRAKLARAIELLSEWYEPHRYGMDTSESTARFLAAVAIDSTQVEGEEGVGADVVKSKAVPAPNAPCPHGTPVGIECSNCAAGVLTDDGSPCPACSGLGAFDRRGNPVKVGSPESQTACNVCRP